MYRTKASIYTTITLCLAAGPLTAQDSLVAGTRVRVTAPSLRIDHAVGIVQWESPESLAVEFGPRKVARTLPKSAVIVLDVSRGNSTAGALGIGLGGITGFGLGGVVGGLVGAAFRCHTESFAVCPGPIVGFFLGGLVGAVSLGYVGGTTSYEVWRVNPEWTGPHSSPAAPHPLSAGDRVRITAARTSGFDRLEGTLLAIGDDTLIVRSADGTAYAVPMARVTILETLTLTQTHGVDGGVAGFAGGALLSRSVVGGLLGGTAGAIVGSMVHTSAWGPAHGWHASPQISFDHGRTSLGLSVGF